MRLDNNGNRYSLVTLSSSEGSKRAVEILRFAQNDKIGKKMHC